MLRLTDLLGQNWKVTSDEKMIFIFHQRNKGGNRDYCSHISVTFETTGKFLIVFVRLILGKKGLMELWGHDGKLTSDMGLSVEMMIIAAIFQ